MCTQLSVSGNATNLNTTPCALLGKTIPHRPYTLVFTEYVDGYGQVAVQVLDQDGAPYAKLTVCLDLTPAFIKTLREENCIVVKTWSENQSLVEYLRTSSDLFTYVSTLDIPGFNVKPQVWRVNMDMVQKYGKVSA